MHSVECTRLTSLLINEVQIKASPAGIELHADGVYKSDDLLGPPGSHWFSYPSFPADIVEKARELVHLMEEYVASTLGAQPRKQEPKEEPQGTVAVPGGSLAPDLDLEEDSELPDLNSFVKDMNQF